LGEKEREMGERLEREMGKRDRGSEMGEREEINRGKI